MGRKNIEDVYPLSAAQEGLLFHTLSASESEELYVPQLTCVLENLDVPAFEGAWQRLVDRHAVLRTAFAWKSTRRPLQIVGRRVRLRFERRDWTGLSGAERSAKIETFLESERRRGFDLSRAPAMRLALLRLEENTYQFVWTFHHILLDGWSQALLLREVLGLYESGLRGREIYLEPPPTYRSYIEWLGGQDLDAAESFWRHALRGISSPHQLSVEAEPNGDDPSAGVFAERAWRLPADTTRRLDELARHHRVTLSTVFQGAWAVLLSFYSATRDVVFGTVFSGRPETLAGAESMVGLLLNTLPTRARVGSRESGGAWLEQLQRRQIELRQFEWTPLIRIQRWSEIPQGGPLFDSLFVFENYPWAGSLTQANGSGLGIRAVRTIEWAAYALTLLVRPGKQLDLTLQYDRRRLQATTVRRMADHLELILGSLLSDPTRSPATLPRLTSAQCQQLLREWNDRPENDTWPERLDDLLERQVRRGPEAVAVTAPRETLSYQELARRSAQLARLLQSRGVGPEVPVGMLLERSCEMVVAIFGVLKAGGAYVPLDLEAPREYMAWVLDDNRPPVLLTRKRWLGRLPRHSARVISLDAGWEAECATSADTSRRSTPESLAYVTYTSGSTGRPKGVMSLHRGVVNHLSFMVDAGGLTSTDVILKLAAVTFDATARDLIAPLAVGARVVMVSEEEAKDPAALLAILERHHVSVLSAIVPTRLRGLMAAAGSRAPLRSVRLVLVSGESLRISDWEGACRLFGDRVRVANQYGPTEGTLTSTFHPLGDSDRRRSFARIGRPISRTGVFVLDCGLGAAPPGVIGDVYLSGTGVTRGYVNRPANTAASFLPDPWSRDPGRRLYRTGDLGRHLIDGNLEFQGRIDHQVKIRGVRVELGEIETVLARHPGLSEVAVTAVESNGDTLVAAYFVARPESEVTVSELHRFLAETLLPYMMPSSFTPLDALPRTRSGKVDRRALPAPERSRPQLDKAYAAPRTSWEARLAEIWAQALDLEQVGIHDDFFELGGDSITCIGIAARVQPVPLTPWQIFEYPTISQLAAFLDTQVAPADVEAPSLPPADSRLLEQFRSEGRQIEDAYPLSPMQQGMLFHTLYQGDAGVYFQQMACTLRGALDADLFRRAWQQVMDRHPVLRTSIVAHDTEQAVQVVESRVSVPWEERDWRHLETGETSARLAELLGEDRGRTFELSRAPLMRLYLLEIAADRHLFVWSHHHVILDGWSVPIVLREVIAVYRALAAGHRAELPPPPPFRDFIAWLWRRDHSAEEAFWRRQLQGFRAPTPLGTDRPAAGVATRTRFAHETLTLTPELTADLGALGRRNGLTSSSLFQAFWGLLLSRYSTDREIVFGSVTAGRPADLPGVESMAGVFINTLPLRLRMVSSSPVGSWLADMQVLQAGLRRYESTPLVRIRGWSDVPAGTPLFESIVVFGNFPVDESLRRPAGFPEVHDLRLLESTHYPLTVIALPEDGLRLRFLYDCGRFDAVTVRRMLHHLHTLLAGWVAEPEGRVGSLAVLTRSERHQVLAEWNDSACTPGRFGSLPDELEAWAERTPERIALVFEQEHVSYRNLDSRANRLARCLRDLGVAREGRVALSMGRSVGMALGVLGTLKAGGTCVPLDPAYPETRRSFMLQDAGVSVLLRGSAESAGALPEHGVRDVVLDEELERKLVRYTDSKLCRRFEPEQLFYVIFTSGSTGRPKGVALPHRVMTNLLECQLETTLPAGRVLQLASLSFDISFLEMFDAWCSGGTLFMVSEDLRRDVPALARYLADAAIEKAILPVVVLHRLTEEDAVRKDPRWRLRELATSGEQLRITPSVTDFFNRFRDVVFRNFYGPSEAHVITALTLRPAPDAWPALPSVGRPIHHTQMHVLDRDLMRMPLGVPGELSVGGVSLARGYLGRPALTAEKFVPDPFTAQPGGRLYRIGDLARLLVDGEIEFLGRLDHQVKVRGHRVELGEIEAVLGRHPSLNETAVLLREDRPGDQRLVAYVTINVEAGATAPSAAEVRAFLADRLPEVMVPSAVVLLDGLPLNPNGKVDRRALPAPPKPTRESDTAALRNPVEEVLAAHWEQLLNVEHVGPDDDFFDLGGHSLLATQAISRIRQAFQIDLPLRRFFEARTLEGLAQQVDEMIREGAGLGTSSIEPVPRDRPLPLSFAQQRLWFMDQLEPGSSAYNLSTAAQLAFPLHVGALKKAFEELVRRHEVLRTAFTVVDDEAAQVVEPASDLALPVVDLGDLSEFARRNETRRLAVFHAHRPFRLSRAPLLRVCLLRHGAGEHVLLMTIHHIVSDGWSTAVLLREIEEVYGAFSQGHPAPLPELDVQYADFAVWQRRWMAGEILERHLAYWSRRLAGRLGKIRLPSDRPRTKESGHRGARCRFEIDPSLSGKVRQLSRHHGVTPFMTMLAAFKTLLYRSTGQEDVLVGADIANRNRGETEGLIGFFVNMLVLRTDLSGNPTFVELLNRVRETSLGAYTYQDLPFEKLVEVLQPERSRSHSPLFQVVFNFNSSLDVTARRRSVTAFPIRFLEIEEVHVRFELALLMTDDGNRLQATWLYSSDLFDRSTVERLHRRFETLVRSAVDHPETRIKKLELLAVDEKQELQQEERRRESAKYKKLMNLKSKRGARVERSKVT